MASDLPVRPSRRRFLLILLVLAALAAGGLMLRSRLSADPAAGFMTAQVVNGSVEETVLATGLLKPSRLVAVGSQASGRVTSVKVRLGDKVRKGDLVAEIDSITQENALRTAKASLANVRAQREEKLATQVLNAQTLARQRTMVAQRAVSQADFESAEASVKTIAAQIAALEAQIIEAEVAVSTAEANLSYTRITAPMDGTVLAIVSQQGQTVNAAQTTPTIVILGQLDVMTVRAEISEADIVKVSPGQPLFFTIVGEPDRRFEAKLGFIEPAPESIVSDSSFSTSTTSSSSSSSSSSTSSAVYYIGVFDVPNPEGRLRTYMTAEVHIVLGTAADVPVIPAAALGARAGDGSYEVRVLAADGTLTARRVEIGLNDKVMAQVRSGLALGERVVTGERTGATTTRSGPPGPMGF
ncbi:efflux RND transporter periplasmic adaptor subunit [Aquabacter sp. L1I39]|uniref:efflux RND transporter periplasmic adaptor subunit n=1 Tax=Aquabacter sp. L1I39 TaxID=2820278 RepID=UPI001ADB5D58|nr:efflux RND transporter periplasmic adaptor subunit [Aquabacter sp. L1I39]QTL02931.1 efflux RND transporter periplasmic adaptor subunit [Aquabacter sp. L1I39]